MVQLNDNEHLIENSPENQNINSDLSKDYFEKEEYDSEFKFVKIGLRPHIFFGEITIDDRKYYKLVVFNKEHTGGNKKTCGFNELKDNDGTIRVVSISIKKINNNYLIELLSLLVSYKYRNEYKTIKKELKECLFINKALLNKIIENRGQYVNPLHDDNICIMNIDFGFKMEFIKFSNLNDFITNILNYLKNIMDKIGISDIDNLFKKKDDKYISTYSAKCRKKNIFKTTCYYIYYWIDKNLIIFFSGKKNDEYYYLLFMYNNNVYIAMYDNDNKIVSIYPFNYNIINNYNYIYPSIIYDIVKYGRLSIAGLHNINLNNTLDKNKKNNRKQIIISFDDYLKK